MNEAVNEVHVSQSTWEPFVGRGALGGLIGEIVIVTLAAIYVIYARSLIESPLPFAVAPLALVAIFTITSGLLRGAMVGYIVFEFNKRFDVAERAMVRSAIGMGFLLIWGIPQTLFGGSKSLGYSIGSALLVGGLAGLRARPGVTSAASALDDNRGSV